VKKLVVSIAIGLMVLSGAVTAAAHPVRSFRACTKYAGQCFDRGAAFIFGDVVLIKGHVLPAHAHLDAVVMRRKPHRSVYRRVGTVPISDRGGMRFRWDTSETQLAYQGAPYLFRFRIPGHGVSNATEVNVVYGE
jgi:hypothetical protein